MLNYYEYLFIDSSLKTVGEFIAQPISPAKYFIGKETSFLDIQDDQGVRNRDRIFLSYTSESDLTTYTDSSMITKDSPIYPGTLIYIPKDQLFDEVAAVTGKDLFMKQQNVTSFLDENLVNLLLDPKYVKPDIIRAQGANFDIKLLNETAQVWVWIRALNKIVNITKFIRMMDSSTSKGGGSFSLTLAPIKDIEIETLSFISGRDVISSNHIVTNREFNTPFFAKYVQQNDVIFIRYEVLEMEKKRGDSYDQLFIEKNQLPGQVYDMIGLVDDVAIGYSAINNEPNISVSGRDFTKLLVEDGSYFLPFVLLQNSEDFFVNIPNDRKILNRIFISGNYTGLFFYTLRTIKDTLGFIFNQLTNTGVIPDSVDLFGSYAQDKRSKTYELSDADSSYLNEIQQKGVWQIIKLVVDSQLDNRRLANSDITRPDGTLMEQIQKVCQDPFVEFWGDTFGDTYSFIVRQPPFSKDQVLDYMKKYSLIRIEAVDVDSFSFKWETEYYSWYQIEPQNCFLGKSDFITAAYVPIVWLPEYVDAFGNHKKVIPDNYISYRAIRGESGKHNTDLFRQAVAEDLKYAVESTCYLPFTRNGSITIKGGDRRIKRGTFIYFAPTNEVFYVDQVHHSLRVGESDIDRSTTLSVSRGMVEDYISGRNYIGKKMSYFNIVNTDYIRDSIITRIQNGEIVKNNVKGNVLVDPEVFNFFLERKQMEFGSGLSKLR